MNSGLQILASCNELVDLINHYHYYFKNKNKNILTELEDAFNALLNKKIFDPTNFINYFCSLNVNFIRGSQCCSQDFIRTLIRNINDIFIRDEISIIPQYKEYCPSNYEENLKYNEFIKSKFPESEAISLFSGITKYVSFGQCQRCNEKINFYTFNYFIDQQIYLNEFKRKGYNFSFVLKENICTPNTLTMDCPKCKGETYIKEHPKIIKLPKILIFTLERYQGSSKNNMEIIPDEIIDMKEILDKSLKCYDTIYELFAVNIKLGSNQNDGHEICQVKRGKIWYEVNDVSVTKIHNLSNFDSIYGLFYKRKK